MPLLLVLLLNHTPFGIMCCTCCLNVIVSGLIFVPWFVSYKAADLEDVNGNHVIRNITI